MSFFWGSCRNYCQSAQNHIEKWVPGIPSDFVWGLAKSSFYSFTACVILTKSGITSGIKSAFLSSVVLMIYTLAIIIFKKYIGKYFLDSKSENKHSTQYEVLIISFAVATLLVQRTGFQLCAKESVLATGIPLALRAPGNHTPLFGIISCW